MNKKKIILIIIAVLILIGVGVWFFYKYNWRFLKYPNNSEYQTQKYIDDMEKKYREDTYGGNTPEETLNLFIEALKAGDVDLASKYFVVEKQEEMKSRLIKIKESNYLNDMIRDLDKEKESNMLSDNRFNFYIYNDKNTLSIIISLIKNPFTDKWKIEEL